jgi:hypothetical protein
VLGPRASNALLRLETADQIFGALIAFSDLLEQWRVPEEGTAADRMLRRLYRVGQCRAYRSDRSP